jgi:hypothetical protein
MQNKNRMTREDALALLGAFRQNCEQPPQPDPERVARRFVQIVFPDRRTYKKGPAREERG